MGWIHDSGYRPAYANESYPAIVLLDGTETSDWSRQIEPKVIGWRSACACGWSGAQFCPRAEWPSPTGRVPAGVDGWESGGATFQKLQRHIDRALPDLAVYDLAAAITSMKEQMCEVVQTARRSGLPWSMIAQAAGVTTEQAARRWSNSTPRPAPQREHQRPSAWTGELTAALRRTWLVGFTSEVYRRLTATERAAAEQHKPATSAGPSVALVLANREQEVTAAFKERFPNLRAAQRRQLSGSGYRAGMDAGRYADLGGSRLAGQRRELGR